MLSDVARFILNAVGLLICYALFFAFLLLCIVICPPVYLTCMAGCWATGQAGEAWRWLAGDPARADGISRLGMLEDRSCQ